MAYWITVQQIMVQQIMVQTGLNDVGRSTSAPAIRVDFPRLKVPCSTTTSVPQEAGQIMKSKLSAAVAAFSIVAAYAALAGSTASAAVVTFTLTNVQFSDGGSATGSFTYDSSLVNITSANITTTTVGTPGPGMFPGQTYTDASRAFVSEFQPNTTLFFFITGSDPNLALLRMLVSGFPPSISTSSPILLGFSAEQASGPVVRTISAGSLVPTAVPIPAAGLPFGLVLAGGGLLGWWRRRQKIAVG
jgi:hypothetical protein